MPEIKVAHESEDDTAPVHCPWCGAGQIIGNPDGSIHCDWCQRSFTVRLQPQFPAMPQEMDERNAAEPQFDANGDETDESLPADPADPIEPGEEPPPGDPQQPPAPEEEEEDPATASQVPQALRTSTGAQLDVENYLDHLAVLHASDRDSMIAQIQRNRMESARG